MEKMKFSNAYSKNYFYSAEITPWDDDYKVLKKHGVYTSDDHPSLVITKIEDEIGDEIEKECALVADVHILQFNEI